MFRIRGECACDDIEDTVCKILLAVAPGILRTVEGTPGNDVMAVERFDGHTRDDLLELDEDWVRVRGIDPLSLVLLVEIVVTDEDDRQI